MTNRLAYSISLFLYHKDSIAEEEVDVYAYGFEVLIDSVLETMLLIVAGLALGYVFETIIFILVFGMLRSFTGGYHASSKIMCTIMTVSTCVVNLIFSCIVSKYTWAYMILGLAGVVGIWKYAPKGHTNKPLEAMQKSRNRTVSRMLCVIYIIGILILKGEVESVSNVLALTLFQVSVLLLGKEEKRHEEVA